MINVHTSMKSQLAYDWDLIGGKIINGNGRPVS